MAREVRNQEAIDRLWAARKANPRHAGMLAKADHDFLVETGRWPDNAPSRWFDHALDMHITHDMAEKARLADGDPFLDSRIGLLGKAH